MHLSLDYNETPLLVIWETTRACGLACKHCRAEAIPDRHPAELSFREGKELLDAIHCLGTPLVVFSGGDPLQRPDLDGLIRHAKSLGLRTGTIPAATSLLTASRVRLLKEAGLDQMAMSLDGPAAELHDTFRGVPGAFDHTMQAAGWAHEVGLPLQINTVFGAWNHDRFDAMAALVQELQVVFWEIFFLVPMGRGAEMACCSPEQCEALYEKIYALSKEVDFVIKVTEGQPYRRYVAERMRTDAGGGPRHPGRSAGSVNSGKGFCFVDHIGNIYPSGFLPLSAGNIRNIPLVDAYRNSRLFKELRDPSLLKGRCGRCRYSELCGGSRARAFAATGDYLEEDFCCMFEG